MQKDYYKILGVSKSATQDEIKKAFRKKAHELHPDKSGGDSEKFKEANEAYQILGNTQKRSQYDKYGSDSFQGQGFGGTGMNWEDFANRAGSGGFGFGGSEVNFDFGDLGDLFGNIFGFGGPRRRSSGRNASKGEDIEIEMSISFEDSVFGVEKIIRLMRIAKCSRCSGNKAEPGTKISECPRCGGSGEIITTRSTMFGTIQSASVCPQCRGEGSFAQASCKKCSGEGRVRVNEEVKIKIPAGIESGQTVRMSGLGNAGEKGGQSGDLYIQISVRPHKKFVREGFDIISSEEIEVPIAVLGGTVRVETVHGPVNLKIPQGTQSGTRFKIASKGVARSGYSSGGNHIAIVEVKIPKKLSKKEKKIYEELKGVSEEKGSSWF